MKIVVIGKKIFDKLTFMTNVSGVLAMAGFQCHAIKNKNHNHSMK